MISKLDYVLKGLNQIKTDKNEINLKKIMSIAKMIHNLIFLLELHVMLIIANLVKKKQINY